MSFGPCISNAFFSASCRSIYYAHNYYYYITDSFRVNFLACATFNRLNLVGNKLQQMTTVSCVKFVLTPVGFCDKQTLSFQDCATFVLTLVYFCDRRRPFYSVRDRPCPNRSSSGQCTGNVPFSRLLVNLVKMLHHG